MSANINTTPNYNNSQIQIAQVEKASLLVNNFYKHYYATYPQLTIDNFLNDYPTLLAIECLVYKLDDSNESNITNDDVKLSDYSARIKESSKPLAEYLIAKSLYDNSIAEDLYKASEYYLQEYRFCKHVVEKQQEDNNNHSLFSLTVEKIEKINEFRSFDCRILHKVVCKLNLIKYDKQIFEIYAKLELLSEIEDDLADYTKDIINNTWNTYRCFVHIFESNAKQELTNYLTKLMQEIKEEISQHKQLQHLLRSSFVSTDISTITIPDPIIDEAEFKNKQCILM